MKRYAFDFFNTLDLNPDVREVARRAFKAGHEVHVVSAISPGIEFDYEGELRRLEVPFTQIHRVDHFPEQKVEVLLKLEAAGFWDDLQVNVNAARLAGIPSCLVGVDHPEELRVVKRGFVSEEDRFQRGHE